MRMSEISNIIQASRLALRSTILPTNMLLNRKRGALLAQAVEIEAETFLAAMKDLKLTDGRDRLVRHGHGPTRAIQTGMSGPDCMSSG